MEKSSHSREVKFLSSDHVRPAGETPDHSIWLSGLDLVANRRCYTPIIYLYKKHNDDDHDAFFDVEKLKSSLAKALVPFYPFAGEYGHDEDGRLEIRCTGKGVLFVEASCERTMEEFGDFTPSPVLQSLLFPPDIASVDPPCPLMALQLTRFKCGGVCLGTAVHHMVGDGTSSMHFISAWADVARGIDPSSLAPPFLDRSLLKARCPPSVEFEHAELDHCTGSSDVGVGVPPRRAAVGVKTFHLTKAQVAELKAQGKGVSTFSAVASHAWRTACKARELPRERPTRVFMTADIRGRMEPPLPANLLGNAALPMSVGATVGEVVDGTIDAIGRVFEEGKKKLHSRYFRSQIDFMETTGRTGRVRLPPEGLVAVNWLNLPLYKTDFGWGLPAYVHRAALPTVGMVYVVRNVAGEEGSLMVTVALEEEHMEEFGVLFYDDLHC